MSAITTPSVPVGSTTPPPATTSPRPLRWTVPTFHAANASGAFAGRRPLLVRGVLLEQGPMNEPHATALEKVMEILRRAFGPGWRVRGQLPLVPGLDSDPLPDLAVLPGDSLSPVRAHPTTAALVVEISDTTLTFDTTDKAELYATGGIADYWVLDLNARQLHVYRDPAPLAAALGAVAYRTHNTLGAHDTVSPLAAPTSTIRVADLLP
jgi:Uma2 family endonuclease